MTARSNTPAPVPGQLITGHFREGPRYATYRENGTRDWIIVETLDGHGRFGSASGECVTEPGDIVLVAPGTLHDYGTALGADAWEILWAHFIPRPHWLDWLNWPVIAPGLHLIPTHGHEFESRITQRFRDVVRLNASSSRLREALGMNALEEVLLWCDHLNPHTLTLGVDARIRRALDLIHDDFARPLSVAALARHSGLSPSRFTHLFQHETGATPQRYLELRRLGRARELLQFTQAPIAEIARQVGYENPFYFTLRFKRLTGQNPRAWRLAFTRAR
ncbi:helix-turn-helix domain-containing protein [Horticoccus luteus]|uniref:Helix-turn-helix domain-containing protein n=1 Tax=Horticoccus luteus TaxID=2862869 RepID=A0A8F9TUR3_9BACT|nr:helix-turn-helix domain-containing protein [Horticoccus luteus]QYM79425.1 helix-turn-helix domain-containing protein [Horticoccus luteus]